MSEKTIQFHATVMTPNGVGIVQGRLIENGQPGRILVSHDPRLPGLPEEIRKQSMGGPWVLHAYEPGQVRLYAAPENTRGNRHPPSSVGVSQAAGDQ